MRDKEDLIADIIVGAITVIVLTLFIFAII
jgi:hypothetical protein